MNLPLVKQIPEHALGRIPASGLARSLERLRLQIYLVEMVIDAVALCVSFAIALLAYKGAYLEPSRALALQLMLPIYLTIMLQNGTYSLEALKNWRKGAARAITALLISGVLLNFVISFGRMDLKFSRASFILTLVIAAALAIGSRKLVSVFIQRHWGPNPVNTLVIHDGGPPLNINHTYRANAAEAGLSPDLGNPHALDIFARYVRNMDHVVVSCAPDRRLAWAMVLKGAGVHGEVLSDFMHEIGALGVVRREEAGITTLLVSTGPLGLRDRLTKRLFDVAVASLSMIAVMPILLVAGLAIKLEDGGPVLFRQQRIGRRNQLFSIYKLRTMKVERSDSTGNRSASKDDDRITRVGRFLRKTSIDELPQILNVFNGDMSLVGPRPHAIGSLAGDKLFWEVDQRYWHRHSLRPGLTGLAQVRGFRGATDKESDLTSRLQADLEYLSGWTIWRDIAIMLATVKVLVHDRAF